MAVLGPLVVHGDDGPITIRVGRPRRLLSLLAMRPGVPVAVDVIIEHLWGDEQPANARNALQALVSYLRRQLEPINDRVAVERAADSYVLRLADPESLDSVRYEHAIRAADGLGGEAAFGMLDAAIQLWRGDPHPDAAYDDFASAEIARLTEMHATAREQRATSLLDLGRANEAIQPLQMLAAEFPLRESVWCALMLAMYRARRQADALRVYATARQRLIDELGVEPCAELQDLERRVLDQDPSLDWQGPGRLAPATPAAPAAPTAAPSDATAAHGVGAEPERHRRVANPIPVPVSSLVGRAFEIGHVEQLVASNRLVTLVGPGGIGKSRLALEVARRRAADVNTTVVDFGSLGARSDVAGLLASAAAVPLQPGADPIVAIASSLADAQHLWVLETCEHVLDSVAVAASALLRLAPGLTILATSRQALGVRGEVAWPVPPLELADAGASATVAAAASAAVRLFVERATAARPDFVLDDSNAAAIAEICRALDGLPLAIELAAARVNLLSPNRIVERLGDRFALLAKGGRDADPRQASLRATIDWSYSLLAPDEQRCFDRLSVIDGDFDLEAAVGIAGHELAGDPVDHFEALLDRSLVRRTGDDRFALLDTLRSFGAGRLGSDPHEQRETRDRHADWYLDVARTADPKSHGPLPDHWPRLRQESANCQSALEWFVTTEQLAKAAALAGALAGYWVLDGQIARAEHWLNQLRDVDADDATRASLLRGVSVLEMYRSRFRPAAAACVESVAHARATGDQRLVGSTLLPYGSSLWGLGDFEGSRAALEEAVQLFEATNDRRGAGFALARLGRTLSALDDAAALDVLQRAVEVVVSSGDGWMSCVAHEHFAGALLKFGELERAQTHAETAVEIGRAVGSNSGQLVAIATVARTRILAGDAPGAVPLLLEVLGRAVDYANPGVIADALDGWAVASSALGDPGAALEAMVVADRVRAEHDVSAPAVAERVRRALWNRLSTELGPEADAVTRAGRERSVDSIRAALAQSSPE